MKYIPINWALVSEPVNWIIILLILSLWMMLFHTLMPTSGATPDNS